MYGFVSIISLALALGVVLLLGIAFIGYFLASPPALPNDTKELLNKCTIKTVAMPIARDDVVDRFLESQTQGGRLDPVDRFLQKMGKREPLSVKAGKRDDFVFFSVELQDPEGLVLLPESDPDSRKRKHEMMDLDELFCEKHFSKKSSVVAQSR